MTRRELLLGTAAAAPALLAKAARVGRDRISAVTDEIARTPEAAIAFAHQYGLKWLELRDVPGVRGKNYFFMEEVEARAAAKQLAEAKLGVSFLNTNLLKFSLPGTEPLRRTPETPEAREARIARDAARFASMHDDLRRSIRSAHIFGCRYLRVFSFSRVAEPAALFPRIADILGALAKTAEAEGVVLLLENETSCNAGTCEELARVLKMAPSPALGINWDALNGKDMKENPLPDGYRLLPAARVHNVQIKGRSILPEYPDRLLDWAGIFDALARDGYRDKIGLETHIFGEGQIAASHASMRAILKIVDPWFRPAES